VRLPSDGDGETPALLRLVAALADPAQRATSARALAAAMGADDLLVFIRDEDTGALVTGPGFAQTLPQGARWRAFLAECMTRVAAAHTGMLPLRTGEPDVEVTGYARTPDEVIVLVGCTGHQSVAMLMTLLPLLVAVFRSERASAFAEVKVGQSADTATRAKMLARTLELARLQLEAALASARHSRDALASSNQQLRDQALELESQAEELQATAAQLEERTEEAEAARSTAEAAKRSLHVAFSQSPAAVAVTTGSDHRFVLVNPRFETLVARSIPVGTPFRDALPEISAQGYEKLLDGVRATGKAHVEHESYALLDKGGAAPDEGWYDFVYQPLVDERGRVESIMQHAIDVTVQVRARKEMERLYAESERDRKVAELARSEAEYARHDAEEVQSQFRALIDTIPTLAWTAGKDGAIDWYNARWFEYTGTSAADMEGWGWTSVHDPAVLPAVMERWRASIASGREFEMTFPLRGRNGVFRQFLTRVVPTFDPAGRVVRWFGTNTDVEDEARLRRAAEEANRAKSEFLAVMSHELRTPLNAIGGYAELIEMGIQGEVTPAQRDFLGKIQKSQRHLLGLINGVLNYSRVEAGVVHFAVEDVPLDEALATCEALITPQMLAKGQVLTYTPCEHGLVVRADGEKVQQVLLNLLTNAMKFTDRNGRIELACRVTENHVRIVVGDSGRGIAADQLSRVFEPFVQLDANLTRTQEGVGLGLAISRDLARGMRGDLTVESVVGEGSVFTLVLPRG
jgi:PAS domain S-box-containing protein